jgi:predicted nucleotidyltransferase
MQWVAGIDADPAYGALAARAIDGELDGVSLRVCGLEDLIAMKRAAGRPRDLDDLRRLGVG